MNKSLLCCLSAIVVALTVVDAAIPQQNLERKNNNKGELDCVQTGRAGLVAHDMLCFVCARPISQTGSPMSQPSFVLAVCASLFRSTAINQYDERPETHKKKAQEK